MPDTPQRKWSPIRVGQPLDESIPPTQVGGSGLTDNLNLTYERSGAWGKRSGSGVAYNWGSLQGAFPNSPFVSGIRWYRAYPTALTETIFCAQGSLWKANDIGSTPTKLLDFVSAPTQPIDFCSARDPNAMQGTGSDVLIITGGETNLGFATSYLVISTTGANGPGTVGFNPAPTATITVQFQRNSGSTWVPDPSPSVDPFQITYQILPADNPTSIANALVTLINQCYAVATNGNDPDSGSNTPYLGQAYVTQSNNSFPEGSATIHFGALFGGAAGDNILYKVTYAGGANDMGGNNGALSLYNFSQTATYPTPGTPNPFISVPWTGGGGAQFGPLKYDGATIDGLSYQISMGFSGCTTWHNHVWFWGNNANPDSLYATDINQPEGFVFMTVNGPYYIGAGDGDPSIQDVVPIGNALYPFKTNSIYQISGFDFQGATAFQVQPQVQGYGVPAANCVAILENALVFWSGKKFCRLQVGAYEPEHIGMVIPYSEGTVSNASQNRIRAVAGDFQVLAALNGNYFGGGGPQTVIRPSIALFSYDSNDLLVYDDDATQRLGKYAWSRWTGWNVGYWIPFGQGENSAQTGIDDPLLLWMDPSGTSPLTNVFGTMATSDNGTVIPWRATTGWVTTGSPELQKNLDRIFIEVNATVGASIVAVIQPSATNLPNVQLVALPPVAFVSTSAPTTGESYNILKQQIAQARVSPAYLFRFLEDGTSLAGFELVSYDLDAIQEAINP